MLKKWTRSAQGRSLIAWVGALYLRLVYKTTRWRFEGFETLTSYCQQKQPFIVCFWHERLLMGALAWRQPQPFYMVISASRDGQLISETVAHFGMKTIAGSSKHGGTAALKTMLSLLKAGSAVGITPDGPRGPRRKVQPGVLIAAQMAKVPIVPFAYTTSSRQLLSSWDRFMLALPFGRGIMAFGEPLPPPASQEDFPAWAERIEETLNTLTDRLDAAIKESS